jgi:hypothetical protein
MWRCILRIGSSIAKIQNEGNSTGLWGKSEEKIIRSICPLIYRGHLLHLRHTQDDDKGVDNQLMAFNTTKQG